MDNGLMAALEKGSCNTLVLSQNTPLPFRNLYRTPSSLGHDRVAAAAGARSLFPDRDALIMDMGTAITFDAVSAKGAKGVMQLMPEVIGDYRVHDPFSPKQSILAGAKLLKTLEEQYGGDRIMVAAAYNAGVGAVTQYGGIPPYAETREYVAKVGELYSRYRKAMGLTPRPLQLRPAR